eukprot:GEMP01000293.1.p1 GENE.GEMP01000293.1~~GEMP01000293.1.p1  ORF type:complete len:1803 (+),score=303.92 GEMP01000293.1:255-5663(+)
MGEDPAEKKTQPAQGKSSSWTSIRWNFIARRFDTGTKRIGYFYGRTAARFPFQCMCGGFVFCAIFAIPFFLALNDGMRGKTNPRKGLSLRTDIRVWLPSKALPTKQYDRIIQIMDTWETHKQDFGQSVFRGRMDTDASSSSQQESDACRNTADDSEEIVFLYHNAEKKLCDEEYLKAIWEYENYRDQWQSTDGYAFRPDFCEIDVADQSRFESCGDYKGQDIGFPKCRKPYYDDDCRVPACLDYNAQDATSGCSTVRSSPDNATRMTRWCYVGKTTSDGVTTPLVGDMCYDGEAPMQNLCSDVKSETNITDGSTMHWSETACVQGTGLGMSQRSEADWCKPSLNVFNMYQSILKGSQYDVDLQNMDDFDLAVRGWDANDADGPAICSLPGRPGKMCRRIKSVRQKVPGTSSNSLMNVFQMHQVFATYFSNILMKATVEDTRVMKNCPRFNHVYCGGVAPPPIIPLNVTLGTGCVNDDTALVRLLTSLNIPDAAEYECEQAVGLGWCNVADRKSSCSDVRSACPLSCKNDDLCPPDNSTCDAGSTSGCSSFATKETCPSGCSWHSMEIADRTGANVTEGCWECDDSRVIVVKEWYLAERFCCSDYGKCTDEQAAGLCKCFKDVNFCNLFGNIGRELCPQQCNGACSRVSPRPQCCTLSVAACASANDGACMVVGGSCTQKPVARRLNGATGALQVSGYDFVSFLQKSDDESSGEQRGTTPQQESAERRNAISKESQGRQLSSGSEVELDCDATVSTDDVTCECDYTEDSADSRHHDIHNRLYKKENCETLVSTRVLRRQCLLDGYSYKNLLHFDDGDEKLRPPPTKEQRMKYSEDLMNSYIANWKNVGDETVRTSADKKLHDLGIEVGFYSARFFSKEVIEIVTNEIGPLIGTFCLMVIFVICSIGVTDITWIADTIPVPHLSLRRVLLCSLVVVQPMLATLMSWGLGALPIWPVPGDIEEDGVPDGVLPLSILSPMFMHLMLAIIVDFDIILVRSFDRMCFSLPFNDRLEKSVGYAHRTISLSMICGCIAFGFGSWVDLPILTYFCLQSMLGLLGLYATMFSVFLGAFALSERGRHYAPREIEKRTSQVVVDFRRNSDSKEIHHSLSDDAISSSQSMSVFSGSGCLPSKSMTIANARASQLMHGQSVTIMGSIEDVDLGIKLLVVTNDYDNWFSSLLSRWIVLISSVSLEILILLVCTGIMFTSGMQSSVDTTKFLSDNSKIRWFTEKSRGMGGTNDILNLALPPSTIGNFHVKANREYYFGVFEQMRWYYISEPTGVPSTYSWLTSFEMFHRGSVDFDVAVVPPRDVYQEYSTPMCSGCPLEQTLRNDAQLDIDTVNDLTKLDSMLSDLTLERKFNYVNASIAVSDTLNSWLRDLELAQVVNKNIPNFVGSWHDDVIYTQDPARNGTSLRQFTSPNALVAALKAIPVPFQLQFRSRHKAKFQMERRLSSVKEQCPLHESGYSVRAKYWDTHPDDFYEYLHDWFWDQKADWFEGSVCCESELVSKSAVLGKRGEDPNVPHATPFGPEEEVIHWDYNKNDLRITGILDSLLRVHVKWPTLLQQQQSAMADLQYILNFERTNRSEMWSRNELENFVFADNFIQATRDRDIPIYLSTHLKEVAFGVVLVCMLLLHPIYGFAVGMFLAVINFQVIGIMTLLQIDVNVVAFGVITMAIGFEIEYVVHIGHAFMYQDSRGFNRMQDALKEMGVTVFLALGSTALQQLFFLVFTTGLSFQIYCGVMLLIIMKAGMTGFLLVPQLLGLLDERVANMEYAEEERQKAAEKGKDIERPADSAQSSATDKTNK